MNSNISISFTQDTSNDISNEYWIKLYQEVMDETASMEESVELVDSIFDVTPCEEPEETEEQDPVEERTFDDNVAKIFDMDLCYSNFDQNYLTKVIIDRSDVTEPYTLRVTNGVVGETTVMNEPVSEHIEVTNVTFVELKFTPLGDVTATWGNSSTGTPEVKVSGRYLYWEGRVTGSITATYTSKYEVVDITVFANEDGFGECTVVAFYHGLVEELELSPPGEYEEEFELWRRVCGEHNIQTISKHIKHNPPWVTTKTTYKCQCSGNESRHVYSNEYDTWDVLISRLLDKADTAREGEHYDKEKELREEASTVASDHNKSLGQYSFPGITEEVFGGYEDCGETTGDISDPGFYEEMCCELPPFRLPECETVYRVNHGGLILDARVQAELKLQYGKNLRIVPVSPSDGDCGKIITKQRLIPINCCDVTPTIVWDDELSVDTIADNSSGYVGVTGGKPPYKWSISGQEFWLNSELTERKLVTDVNAVRIFTGEACGTGRITVTDGCSTATGVVRSTNGQWVDLDPQPDTCVHNKPMSMWTNISYGTYEYIDGEFRTIQYANTPGGNTSCDYPGNPYPICGGKFPPGEDNPDLCISDYASWRVSGSYPNFTGAVSSDLQFIYFDGFDCSPGCNIVITPLCCGKFSYTSSKTIQEWVC